MTPRQAVLRLASDSRLAELSRSVGLDPGPSPSRDELVARLEAAPEVPTEDLFAGLPDDELKAVAKACGLLTLGGRQAVLERLGRRIEFEPRPSGRKVAARARGTQPGRASPPSPRSRSRPRVFVAIDFETADTGADSACSVALVRVEGGAIVRRESRLVRPPRPRVMFTHIHGITWEAVREAPDFGEVWAELAGVLEGAEFLAAHNAPFDRRVLEACCREAGIAPPELPFRCTVKLARARLGLPRSRLPDVCTHLGIPLRHHDAASDAEACARILMALEPDP